MKKFLRPMAILMTMALISSTALVGCGSNNASQNKGNNTKIESKEEAKNEEKVSFADESYKVDAKWLSDNLNKEDVVVLDARNDGYNGGHIPGATNVTWQQFSNMEGTSADEGWGVVLEPEKLSEKLSVVGVDKDKTVVVYCDTNNSWGDDGRIVWMLRMAGVENAKMLDGGIKHWTEEKYETTKEASEIKATDFKIDKFDESITISTEELKNKLDKVVVLDSREKDEYDGAVKYGEVRGGHIPGAINLPFNEMIEKDGTFKDPKDIEKILDEKGINKEDEIVTYCTAGIRSAHLALTLKMMGYENVKNYDASFYAWAADESLELEK